MDTPQGLEAVYAREVVNKGTGYPLVERLWTTRELVEWFYYCRGKAQCPICLRPARPNMCAVVCIVHGWLDNP